MQNELSRKQVEMVMQKLNWAHTIIDLAQDSNNEVKTADILSGVLFILDSAMQNAEELFQQLGSPN
ncbi:hypothetical protein RCS94_04195 [Orbaceae bacterium ac157xtp]